MPGAETWIFERKPDCFPCLSECADIVINYRVILYHKQATSARTRFVKFADDTVFAFGPVAKLSQLDEASVENTLVHPAAVMQKTESLLGLEPDCLKAEPDYQHKVEVPGGSIHILLAAISTMDPPFEAIEKVGGRFIDLTQARGLPQVELELLRHAYELVLGG